MHWQVSLTQLKLLVLTVKVFGPETTTASVVEVGDVITVVVVPAGEAGFTAKNDFDVVVL